MIGALLHREHTSYREIGHRARRSCAGPRRNQAYAWTRSRYLVGDIEKLELFPEVPALLSAGCRTEYKLVVLSNGDRDMVETRQAVSQDPVRPCDLRWRKRTLSSRTWATYTKAAEIVGRSRPDQILFVASHAFDCIGAKSAPGMRTAIHRPAASRPFGRSRRISQISWCQR